MKDTDNMAEKPPTRTISATKSIINLIRRSIVPTEASTKHYTKKIFENIISLYIILYNINIILYIITLTAYINNSQTIIYSKYYNDYINIETTFTETQASLLLITITPLMLISALMNINKLHIHIPLILLTFIFYQYISKYYIILIFIILIILFIINYKLLKKEYYLKYNNISIFILLIIFLFLFFISNNITYNLLYFIFNNNLSIYLYLILLYLIFIFLIIYINILYKYLKSYKHSIKIQNPGEVSIPNNMYDSWLLPLSIVLLSFIIVIVVTFVRVNMLDKPVNVDWYYYYVMLKNVNSIGLFESIRVSLSNFLGGSPLYISSDNPILLDRLGFLILLYFIELLTGVSEYSITVYMHVALLPLFPLSYYIIARSLGFSHRESALSMVIALISPMFVGFLYGGFHASLFSLFLFSLGLYFSRGFVRGLLFIASLFAHWWTFLLYYIIYKVNPFLNKGRFYFYIFIFIFIFIYLFSYLFDIYNPLDRVLSYVSFSYIADLSDRVSAAFTSYMFTVYLSPYFYLLNILIFLFILKYYISDIGLLMKISYPLFLCGIISLFILIAHYSLIARLIIMMPIPLIAGVGLHRIISLKSDYYIFYLVISYLFLFNILYFIFYSFFNFIFYI